MELIAREALKSKLQKNIEELADKTGFFEGIRMGYESAVHFVEQAPTVEERKRGHWIEHPEHPIGDCSVCGERVPIYSSTAAVKNIKSALTAGLLWMVNPNEHTKVRKINSFIKTNHLENAYE